MTTAEIMRFVENTFIIQKGKIWADRNLEEGLREDRFMLDLEESLHSDFRSAIIC